MSVIHSPCTGPRPSQPWCAALHARIIPCLPSPSISFPLPICSIFHIIPLSFLKCLSHPSISIAPRHAIYQVSVLNQPVRTDVYRTARYCDNIAVRRYQARHPPQCIDCAYLYMLPVDCTHTSACTACCYCIQIAYVPKRGWGRRPAAFYYCIACLHSPMTSISISFTHHPAL